MDELHFQHNNSNKIMFGIASILLIIIIGITLNLDQNTITIPVSTPTPIPVEESTVVDEVIPTPTSVPSTTTLSVLSLSSKPVLIGTIIKNPDIIHEGSGWFSTKSRYLADSPAILEEISDWSGTGYLSKFVYEDDRDGVVIIHPEVDTENGRFIGQDIFLSENNEYLLHLGISNIANTFDHGGFAGDCGDSGIKVIITSDEQETTIFEKTIKTTFETTGKFYDYSIDLGSRFNGNVNVRAESFVVYDEGCGGIFGEWTALDYIDIISK